MGVGVLSICGTVRGRTTEPMTQPAIPELLPTTQNAATNPADDTSPATIPPVAAADPDLPADQRKIAVPDAPSGPIPEWVKVPAGLVIPRNKQVMYIRFRAEMTDTPSKGERQCIVWSNNLGDQKLAIMRSDKDPNKMSEQMAKQMVRAVDGQLADWTGEPGVGNIDVWWDAIGPKW